MRVVFVAFFSFCSRFFFSENLINYNVKYGAVHERESAGINVICLKGIAHRKKLPVEGSLGIMPHVRANFRRKGEQDS